MSDSQEPLEPTEPAEPTPSSNTSWWVAGVFTVAAMLGLWWGQLQQLSIQEETSTTFEFPTSRWMLWSITMVVVGMCVGLAVASAAGWRKRIGAAGLAWGLIPLLPVLAFHLWLAGVMGLPGAFLRVAISVGPQAACAIFVGVYLAAALADKLPET